MTPGSRPKGVSETKALETRDRQANELPARLVVGEVLHVHEPSAAGRELHIDAYVGDGTVPGDARFPL